MRSDLEYNKANAIRLHSAKVGVVEKPLTGDYTIEALTGFAFFFDPNGADRTVTLPAIGTGGHIFTVAHIGAADVITVQDADLTTLLTLTAGQGAILIACTSQWQYFYYTTTGGADATTMTSSDSTITINKVVDNFDIIVEPSNIAHNDLAGVAANEHIDHTTVTLTAGIGLTGGGTIAANRSFALSIDGLSSDTPALADSVALYDADGLTHIKATLTAINAILDHDTLVGFVANEHIDHSGVSITGGSGLTGGGSIDSSQAISLDITGQSAAVAVGTDEIIYYDVDGLDFNKRTFTDLIADLTILTAPDGLTYALLAGRVGGQTLYGGTAASEDLVLQSTANATKGLVRMGDASNGLFYSEVEDRLALGFEEFDMVIAAATIGSKLAVHTQAGEAAIEMHSHETGSGILNAPVIYGARSDGSEGAESVVISGDYLFAIAAVGYDGVDYAQGARIDFKVDGLPGVGDMPTRIDFLVSPDGSETPAIALSIRADGTVQDGSASSFLKASDIGSSVQAFDAELAAIAALATTDGNIIVGNGSTWVAESGATARTSLGLAIGTDVQAWDADLDTWATLTPSANAQSLVTAANYAAMRALLDLEAGTDFYSISAADAAFGSIAGETWTGAHDFGGATSLEIPNSATPTVSVDGQVAIDTTITDFSMGLIKYFSGEEMAVVAMPIAELTTPSDGNVVAYNATTDEFELVAAGSGSVNVTGTPVDNQLAVFTDASTIEGDVDLTFDTTANTLALAGVAGTSILAVGGANILVDSPRGTMTLSNIDALDATTEATIEAAIDALSGITFSGANDFGGADSLEVPNSAAPTLDANGEIAVDTTVTDWSHGILEYYGGEVMGVVAMPIAQFTTPGDGKVVAYNATNDEFELVTASGGGGSWEVLTTGSFSAASTVDIDLTSYTAYKHLRLVVWDGASSASQDIDLRVSIDGGSTFASGATDYEWTRTEIRNGTDDSATSSGDASVEVIQSCLGAWHLDITMHNVASTTEKFIAQGTGSYEDNTDDFAGFTTYSVYITGDDDVTDIRLLPTTGTFSGSWCLYGSVVA